MSSATDLIRDELHLLHRARQAALGTYVALLAVFLLGMHLLWYPMSRTLDWAALAAFFLGAAASAGLAMGIPLLHGRALALGLGLSLGAMALGVGLVTSLKEPVYWRYGPECFAVGTGFSAVGMVVLGAVSGRLWRRFPDPAFMLALSTTFVGVLALHMNCAAHNPIHIIAFHVGPLLVLYFLARSLVRLRDSID